MKNFLVFEAPKLYFQRFTGDNCTENRYTSCERLVLPYKKCKFAEEGAQSSGRNGDALLVPFTFSLKSTKGLGLPLKMVVH